MRATCRLLHSAAAPSGKDFLGILERHFSPAVPRAPKGNNLIVDSARGAWITDVTGRKYLDFQTGIGVTSTGHCHPRVVEAVREQVGKGIHLQQNCGVSRPLVELCEALNANTPSELSRFFFNCAWGMRGRCGSGRGWMWCAGAAAGGAAGAARSRLLWSALQPKLTTALELL